MNKVYNDYSESKDIIKSHDVVLTWCGCGEPGDYIYCVGFFKDFDPNELDCKHIVLASEAEINKIIESNDDQ
jgi:hypothetical protein